MFQRRCLIARGAICVLLAFPWFATADSNHLPPALAYVRVALDADDRTYFAEASEPFELKAFAPPSGPIGVAGMQAAESLVFTTADKTWATDWHPTPRRQFFVLLSGAITIEVESGEKRRFETGDVVLLEDVRGRGHDSKVVSEAPAVFAMVALPSDAAEE